MKFTQSFVAIGLFTGALARPTIEARQYNQIANFVFHGEGDSSYKMGITVDGEVFNTGKLSSINILPILQTDATIAPEQDMIVKSIDINDYNANEQCTFKGVDGVLIDPSLKIDTNTGEQRLELDEPQVVESVSCEGTCAPVNGMFERIRNQRSLEILTNHDGRGMFQNGPDDGFMLQRFLCRHSLPPMEPGKQLSMVS